MPSKCILILLDGLGDRSHAVLGHRTPLEAAHTPVLDEMAINGANGLYHAGRLGEALPSENAHFAMFGYGTGEFPGRGALEALGAGIPLEPGQVAVLARFVSLRPENGCYLIHRDFPENALDPELDSLAEALSFFDDRKVRLRFFRTKGLYGILVLEGEVSRFITDSNPMGEGRLVPDIAVWKKIPGGEDIRHAASITAKSLKKYLLSAHGLLETHPVNLERRKNGLCPINGLVTQRAGSLVPVEPFTVKNGLRGLTISSGYIYHGIGRFLGLDVLKVHDTDRAGRDLSERIKLAREALDRYDFIHVHTKAPDEAGHRKDPLVKKQVIEELDRGLGESIGPLLENPEVLVIVTADHSTPSDGDSIHSGEPVPLLFHGPGQRRDRVTGFDEVQAAGGALGCVRGRELMWLIINALDRAKLKGAMDGPDDRPYWPGEFTPMTGE